MADTEKESLHIESAAELVGGWKEKQEADRQAAQRAEEAAEAADKIGFLDLELERLRSECEWRLRHVLGDETIREEAVESLLNGIRAFRGRARDLLHRGLERSRLRQIHDACIQEWVEQTRSRPDVKASAAEAPDNRRERRELHQKAKQYRHVADDIRERRPEIAELLDRDARTLEGIAEVVKRTRGGVLSRIRRGAPPQRGTIINAACAEALRDWPDRKAQTTELCKALYGDGFELTHLDQRQKKGS